MAVALALSSCFKEQEESLAGLTDKFSALEERVSALENSISRINTDLDGLSVLAAAVEQNFYISDVKNSPDGYVLTFSNGSKIILLSTSDKTLIPMPTISMTQISGLYYWTLNGFLLNDADGNPLRSSGLTPLVKYDYETQQYLISIDGGVTFESISRYSSLVINDTILMQVINSYFAQNSTTLVSKQMLFQVVSEYIRQNYSEVFNVALMDEVVANYIHQNYMKLFRYELLEEIFTQYDFEYYTSQIDVDKLAGIIVTFIQEHNEIFANNEVLFEIISGYLKANQTTIFSDELLLGVINDFIANHEDLIDVNLLTMVVADYIDKHKDTVFDTETVRSIIAEYVRKYYVQAFSQNILLLALGSYISQNSSTIFNETLISEVINNYINNNYTVIFSRDITSDIINEYIKVNINTIIDKSLLFEIFSSYFEKNYNLIIDRSVIINAVNKYIEENKSTIVSVDLIKFVMNAYLRVYYRDVFSVDMLSVVIKNYFSQNTQVLKEYFNSHTGVISDVKVSDDFCSVTLGNGEVIGLVVFDSFARMRDRVQSIIIVPNGNGHVKEEKGSGNGFLNLNYLVSPASMAQVIAARYYQGYVSLELKAADEEGKISTLSLYDIYVENTGCLHLIAATPKYGTTKAIALHVKEERSGDTDFLTEFTPVDTDQPQNAYLKIASITADGNYSVGSNDYFNAVIYNAGTGEWTDFLVTKDFNSQGLSWSTDPPILLDENYHSVYIWDGYGAHRNGVYLDLADVSSLYFGSGDNVSASNPNVDIYLNPKLATISILVRNMGTKSFTVNKCTLQWTDPANPSTLTANNCLYFIKGGVSGNTTNTRSTKYNSQIYPNSGTYFSFGLCPIKNIKKGEIKATITLGNGKVLEKDVYEAVKGSGILNVLEGEEIKIPFEVYYDNM